MTTDVDDFLEHFGMTGVSFEQPVDISTDVDDFIAHFGKKGMKWGVRKDSTDRVQTGTSSGSRKGAASESSQSDETKRKRLSPETKKKLAIGAGIIGAAAIIGAGAYAANKGLDKNKMMKLNEMRQQVETRRKGEAAAKKTMDTYNQKSNWKPSTYSKTNREGKRQATAEVEKYNAQRVERQQAFAARRAANEASREKRQQRIDSFTPSGREKNREKSRAEGEAAVARRMQAFAKQSKWEIRANSPSQQKATPNNYSNRDAKIDKKTYGDDGSARIQKNINKGMKTSDARKREALRQNGAQATRIFLSVKKAQRQENKADNRILKNYRRDAARSS